jgi:hypothetical protein
MQINEGDVFEGEPLLLNIGIGNIQEKPQFANSGSWDTNGTPEDLADDFWSWGDYHLQSQGWRWDLVTQQWTWDSVTSLCIDAANPSLNLDQEPETLLVDPLNRFAVNVRVNMGMYGLTSQASMATHGWALLCDLNNDSNVDSLDLITISELWLQESTNLFGDVSRDGVVNLKDFSLLAQQWMAGVSK